MTVKHLYPDVEPSLNLDFANSKRLDPRITFTRSSTGTYVGSNGLIKTAAVNEARFDHDPTTGESLGLLVEEARTNLVTYSEQFDNAAWSAQAATLVPNAALALNGQMTATAIVEDANTAYHLARSTAPLATAGQHCLSCYVKAGTRSFAVLNFNSQPNAYANFDLATGQVAFTGTGASATIRAAGNNWYFVSVSFNLTGSRQVEIASTVSASNPPYAGTSGDKAIYIWGAQLETGSFPTSYIPTSGSTVTRSADVASMTGTNFSSWYNQEAGSFIAKQKTFATTDYQTVFMMSVGGTNYNGVDLGYHTNNWMTWNVRKLGQQKKMGPPGPGVPYKIKGLQLTTATSYDNATASAYISDPGSTVTDAGFTASTTPPVTMSIGYSSPYSNNFLCGHILRLTYYPYRLTDAQLQALTL